MGNLLIFIHSIIQEIVKTIIIIIYIIIYYYYILLYCLVEQYNV